eukprot:15201984-Alexandrium_andersonii.AAC.1
MANHKALVSPSGALRPPRPGTPRVLGSFGEPRRAPESLGESRRVTGSPRVRKRGSQGCGELRRAAGSPRERQRG